MTGSHHEDQSLETFFDAARAQPEAPDAELLARVLADADAEQAQATSGTVGAGALLNDPRASGEVTGFWQRFFGMSARAPGDLSPLNALGGWPVAASFVMATCVGVWIGTLPQDPLTSSGFLTASDASNEFADWASVSAFGLADASMSLEVGE